MKCTNISDIVNVFKRERTADFYFSQFLRENNNVYEVDRIKKVVYAKDGTAHWFMSEVRYSFWCKGRTYIRNGKVLHSGHPLKAVEK